MMPAIVYRHQHQSSQLKRSIMSVLRFCKLDQRNEQRERGITRRLYGFHSFRHYYASTCANAGVPITTLAQILGDNISTLQRYYLHASDANRDKALAALPNAQSGEREILIAKIRERLETASLADLKRMTEI